MIFTALTLALLAGSAIAGSPSPEAPVADAVEQRGVSDATRALSELEGIYGTCALLLLEARKSGDPRVVLAVEHRHARLAGLHRAVLTDRARLEEADEAGDDRARQAAAVAIDEALMTARRLLGEAASAEVTALGAALERAATSHTVSRTEQLWFAEGALEEQEDIVKALEYALASSEAEHATRLASVQESLVALLRVSQDAARTLAMTEQQDRADHEYRKIAVALSKMRQVFERANDPVGDGETTTGDRYPSAPTGNAGCERLINRYWTPAPATAASINTHRDSAIQLEYWEPDWWADWREQDRYERCAGDS